MGLQMAHSFTPDTQYLRRLTKSSKYLLHQQSLYEPKSSDCKVSNVLQNVLKTAFQETVPSLLHDIAAFHSLNSDGLSFYCKSSRRGGAQRSKREALTSMGHLTPPWVVSRAFALQAEYKPIHGKSGSWACSASPTGVPKREKAGEKIYARN